MFANDCSQVTKEKRSQDISDSFRRTANILIINAMSNYDVKVNRKSEIESDRRRRQRESRKWSNNGKSLCFKNEF